MLKRIAIVLATLLLIPVHAAAQDPQAEEVAYTLEGFWAFKIDDAVIFLFEVDQREDGSWRGRWTRPEVFGSNGVIFNRMSGATRIVATSAIETEEGVQLSFPDPRPEAVPNVFLFELVSDHQVTMTYVDTPLAPFPLIRVVPGTQLGPFDDARIYDRDNAVTEAEYVEPESTGEMIPDVEADEAVTAAVEAAVSEQDIGDEGLSDDFLDGMDETDADVEPEPADIADEGASEDFDVLAAAEVAATASRTCRDLDRPLTAEELGEMWGADFVQIGSGLDIREYVLDNGDVARVTMLGDRVYVNGCGLND